MTAPLPNIAFVRLTAVAPGALIRLMNDSDVRRHLPLARGDFDHAACERFVASKEAIWAEHGYGPYAFMQGDELIGWGGLQPEGSEVDLGLVLHRRFWGLGRMLYARLLSEAFDELHVPSVTVLLPPSRVRLSGLRRLGFTADGELFVGGERFLRFRRWAPTARRSSPPAERSTGTPPSPSPAESSPSPPGS